MILLLPLVPLQDNSSLEHSLRYCKYLSFSITARQPSEQIVNLFEPVVEQLGQFIARVEAAEDEIMRKRIALSDMDILIDGLVYKLYDIVEMIERPFPQLRLKEILFNGKSRSELIRPSGTGLVREIETLRLILVVIRGLPSQGLDSLLATANELEAAMTQAQPVLDELAQALEARTVLRRQAVQLKLDTRNTVVQVRGLLTALYPRRRDYVDSFFLPADLQKSMEDQPAEEPAAKAMVTVGN